jgi:uncharacterized protein YecT (DUF1311 family)
MIRALCLASLLAVCTPALLAAQQDEEFCPEGRTQLDMNICAGDELARADTLLNERYQRLLQAIEPHRVEPLRAAQRAWIRFRDAECDFEASEFEGGSMMPMIDTLCRAHLSRKRAEELQAMLDADN